MEKPELVFIMALMFINAIKNLSHFGGAIGYSSGKNNSSLNEPPSYGDLKSTKLTFKISNLNVFKLNKSKTIPRLDRKQAHENIWHLTRPA